MNATKIAAIASLYIIVVVVAFLLGFPVCWLWNWLMPVLFGVPKIGFWQAWGLILLIHLLFPSTTKG